MTRYEAIKQMSMRDMREFLCDLWLLCCSDEVEGCEICPMQHHCKPGRNGWVDFLNGEWNDYYTTGVSYESFEDGGQYGKQIDSDDF